MPNSGRCGLLGRRAPWLAVLALGRLRPASAHSNFVNLVPNGHNVKDARGAAWRAVGHIASVPPKGTLDPRAGACPRDSNAQELSQNLIPAEMSQHGGRREPANYEGFTECRYLLSF